jgi:hypothetical protein
MKRTKPPSANPLKPSGEPAEKTKRGITNQAANATLDSPRVAIPSILLEGDELKPTVPTSPGQKFVTSAEPELARLTAVSGELPEAYGTGRLFLTARDPRCLYAHWDLTAQQQQRYVDLSTDHYLLLRIHQEDLGGRLVAEIRIGPDSRHSFIHVAVPAAKYLADLGFFSHDGAWKSIATSDTVAAPVDTIAEKELLRFATLTLPTATPARAEALPVATTSPGSTSDRTPQVQNITPVSGLPFPSSAGEAPSQPLEFPIWTLQTASIYLPAAQEISPAMPQLEAPAKKSVDWATCTRPAPIPQQEWTPAQERALAEIIGLSLLKQRWLASQEIAELVKGEVLGKGDFAAAAQVSLASGALGEIQVIERGGFWFNVNAELVIYGATEPNATVTIAGRPIRLRPDGTFSYRFALPDGCYQLPIKAVSSRGDSRQAELEFYRGTVYSGDVSPHPQDPALKSPTAENVT